MADLFDDLMDSLNASTEGRVTATPPAEEQEQKARIQQAERKTQQGTMHSYSSAFSEKYGKQN
jgi:hypothetical protein